MIRICLFTIVAMVVSASISTAGPIFVANQSFESPATTTVGYATSWLSVNDPIVNVYNPYQFQSGVYTDPYYVGANPTTDPAHGGSGYAGIDGDNVAFVFQEAPGTGLKQTLSAVLTAGTQYSLTVSEGQRNGAIAGPSLGSEILLLAGNTVIAMNVDLVGPGAGNFVDQTALLANSDAFSSLIGQQLSIEILTTNTFTPGSLAATDWDNVRLSGSTAISVPEPSSLAMLFLGLPASIFVLKRLGPLRARFAS